MATKKITIEEAVSKAVEEVKANYDSNINFDVIRSITYLLAERIFDGISYKMGHNSFSPLCQRKPHSQEFRDNLSFECAIQSIQAFRK